MQTNDEIAAGAASVTKKANRVVRTAAAKSKFVPLPHVDAEGHEKLPKPAYQEAIVTLFNTFSAKEQATIMSFISSAEFMAPGYGKSTRFIKQWVARAPKKVNLK